MKRSAVGFALLALFALGSACAGPDAASDPSAVSPGTGARSGSDSFDPANRLEGGAPQGGDCRKMDLVFAIDSSGSMVEEQENLAGNLPQFVKVLDEYRTKDGEALDYRIASTASAAAFKGSFIRGKAGGAPEGCDPGPDRPWLERADGKVGERFSCRAQVGVYGGGEDPLESTLLGVTVSIADGSNTSEGIGFLRDDALLAIVIITDEDEGGADEPGKPAKSARPMAEYPVAFDRVKNGRGRWAAAVIAGDTACESVGFGKAAEATRLKEFVADAGKNAVFSSICAADMSGALARALGNFDRACKDFVGPIK